MSTLSRLLTTFLIGCPMTPAVHAAVPQTIAPPGITSPQPNQTKPAPRPNPDASGIYHVGEGVTVPKLIYLVEPEFT